MTDRRWPDADLDPIRRVRILAAATPSAGFVETTFDVPYETFWPWLADLERSVPSFDRRVGRLRIRERTPVDGAEQLRIVTRTAGLPTPFDVRLEPGFCIMRAKARVFLVVMGARPDGDGRRTRYAQVEAIPLPGTRPLRRVLQREVESDVAGIRRELAAL